MFAPTNAAFAALPAGTLNALLADPPALTDVLLYHVANGQVFARALDGSPIATLQGSTVSVELSGSVRINGSEVIAADIFTTSGVIHFIDAVLIPPTPEIGM